MSEFDSTHNISSLGQTFVLFNINIGHGHVSQIATWKASGDQIKMWIDHNNTSFQKCAFFLGLHQMNINEAINSLINMIQSVINICFFILIFGSELENCKLERYYLRKMRLQLIKISHSPFNLTKWRRLTRPCSNQWNWIQSSTFSRSHIFQIFNINHIQTYQIKKPSQNCRLLYI